MSCLTLKVICSRVIFYFPLPVFFCFPAIFLAPLCSISKSFLSKKSLCFSTYSLSICLFLSSDQSRVSHLCVPSPQFSPCLAFVTACISCVSLVCTYMFGFFPFCTFGICFLFLLRFLITCLLWIADLFSSKPALLFFSMSDLCVFCLGLGPVLCLGL